jgi:5-dehydro-2-deoxygluconokinase
MAEGASQRLDLIAIGRVSVDLYGQQLGSRLEDVTTFAKAVGGCPANVAIGAARLGLRSALISRVGDEPMGRFVHEQLAREGVETGGVRVDPQRLTALVLLSVRDAQTFPLIFYRENCADSALSEGDIDEPFVASAHAILVTGTHFSLPAAACAQRKAMDIARAHGRTVILDIDYRPNLWGIGGHAAGESRYARSERVTHALAPVLPDCQLVVGTEEELHVAAGIEDTLAAICHIRSLTDAVIVCKRGARGCVVFPGEIPSTLEGGLVAAGLDIEIYNVLGAGDAFLAGFLCGYLRGEPHAVSARMANACGALAVSRLLCSPEFPTRAELDHFLREGSRHRALRQDPQLTHLHRVTTRRPGPETLRVLTLPFPPARAADASLARIARLVVDAVASVGGGREGLGVSLDGRPGDTPGPGAPPSLWVARAVPCASADDLTVQLIEWPIDVTVHCQWRHSASDPRERREASERTLRQIAALCRMQGHELLVEIDIDGSAGNGVHTVTEALARSYALDIRPDWWLIEPQADRSAWEQCAALVSENDGYCRGMLLRLTDAAQQDSALRVAAAAPLVRGFVAGGSIVGGVVSAWLTGQLSDAAALAQLTERFNALVEAWSAARDARLDEPQRSGS